MTRSRLCLPLCLACVASAAAFQDASQAPPPVFRSVADIVQVDVSVLDGKRAPVKGLVATDFTVLENGRERPVEAFAAVDLPERETSPTDAAWTRDVPSDVVTNRAGSEEGRIVVILMDRTIPVGVSTVTARKVASAAVDALGPNDLAAVVSTSGGVPESLTSNRERLLRAINQRDWSTGVSAEAREIEGELRGSLTDLSSPLVDGRCLCGLCVIHTITEVAASLESMPRRRKSLLFIGSNVIFQHGDMPRAPGSPIEPDVGCALKLEDARKVMWRALDRSGITIHSIDPSGLQVVGPTGQASSTVRGGGVRSAFAAAVQETLQSQNNLGVLPARTGGRVIVNSNGPEERVPDIVRESQSYYVLGFRPSEPIVPGQARDIEVKVNRRDVRVSARREFTVPSPPAILASPEAARAGLRNALRATLPVADLGLSLGTNVFALPGKATSAVAVTLDLSSVARSIAASAAADTPVSVVVGAYDLRGRLLSIVEGRVNLPAKFGGGVDAVETIARLELPPGDHELRAAVAIEGTGRTASVFSRVTVPPFAAVPLALSNLAIVAGPSTVTMRADAMADVIPIVPSGVRVFPAGADATAFMRLYQGVGRSEPIEPVFVTASVIDRAGQVRIRQSLELKAAEFASNRAADCRFTLPIKRLSPGEYLFTVEAERGERVAGRAIRFSVR